MIVLGKIAECEITKKKLTAQIWPPSGPFGLGRIPKLKIPFTPTTQHRHARPHSCTHHNNSPFPYFPLEPPHPKETVIRALLFTWTSRFVSCFPPEKPRQSPETTMRPLPMQRAQQLVGCRSVTTRRRRDRRKRVERVFDVVFGARQRGQTGRWVVNWRGSREKKKTSLRFEV